MACARWSRQKGRRLEYNKLGLEGGSKEKFQLFVSCHLWNLTCALIYSFLSWLGNVCWLHHFYHGLSPFILTVLSLLSLPTWEEIAESGSILPIASRCKDVTYTLCKQWEVSGLINWVNSNSSWVPESLAKWRTAFFLTCNSRDVCLHAEEERGHAICAFY